MEKNRTSIWIKLSVVIAIALLLLWLTFAIIIDDNTDEVFYPIEQTGNP